MFLIFFTLFEDQLLLKKFCNVLASKHISSAIPQQIYCWYFRKGTFNRYVTLKGGTGGNPFYYGALLEREGGSSDTVTQH